MDKQKIALVDDHVIVRNGLKELIEKIGPYTVVLQCSNGRDLLDQLSKQSVDLIMLDLNMPVMNGEETVTALNQMEANIPVVILTISEDDEAMLRMFRLGVRGYLKKDCTAATMTEALSEVFRCGYYHNEFLTYSLRHDTRPKKKSESELILEQLSEREREFLKLVCHEDEYTYDQIAGIMGVQHRTVDGYRESIFEKFEIKSKTGLVLFVLKHQLLEQL